MERAFQAKCTFHIFVTLWVNFRFHVQISSPQSQMFAMHEFGMTLQLS
jgi:hypothetical protein